ncbi:MAG: hypothetical protein GVX96_04210 [Bacteroidetes bacterium]|nr:hypothetical protein [Bacteroidota bacterium]
MRKAYADFRKRFVDLSMQLAHHRDEGENIDASLVHERMKTNVKRKDQAFIRSVSRAVGKESQWSDMDISRDIILNRSFIYTSQHLINAWYELQGSRVEA